MAVHLHPAPGPSTYPLTLSSAFNPQGNGLALTPSLASAAPISKDTPAVPARGHVYLAQYDTPQSTSREFIAETYTFWSKLQNLAAEGLPSTSQRYGGDVHITGAPTPEEIKAFNLISQLYRECIRRQITLINGDGTLSIGARNNELWHQNSLHGILALAEILYVPTDGRGDGIVGEEILHWVNTFDRAPTTAEAYELADLPRPWEHPNFWHYMYQSTLRGHLLVVRTFLGAIASVPSRSLQSIATVTLQLLNSHPRSAEHQDEGKYAQKLASWRAQINNSVRDMESVFPSIQSDASLGSTSERAEWVAAFQTLLRIMQGKTSTILEESEDWREALGAWGLWVHARGRREDLPETMSIITKHFPVDSTLPSDYAQHSLLTGSVERALQQSALISSWLVAHLADLLQKVGVLEPDIDPFAAGLRDHFVLAYTDGVMADQGLWRIVVDYLSTCGVQGSARMSAVLMAVPLEVEADGGVAGASSVVEDVLRLCSENGLEAEMRSVCKIYSEQLVAKQRYGEAVSYCVRADDGTRIARIAARILDEYITSGQAAFIRHVDSIPTSLLRRPGQDSDAPMDEDEPNATPYASLSFLARYREFFALYARGDRRQAAGLLVLLISSRAAPKSFYAIMLLDAIPLLDTDENLIRKSETFELMRCMNEIVSPLDKTDSVDIYGHLTSLARLMEQGPGVSGTRTEREKVEMALSQLKLVSALLARNLGRCFSLGSKGL